jgi:predicted ATPase
MNAGQFLTLADLSEGTKRLICWLVLCLQPNIPTLICIDEPELGVHPNAIPILAGILEKAAEKTQVFVATHSSYLLTQFDLEKIAVMSKDNTNNILYAKPADSGYLRGSLEEFGTAELELLHRNQELEQAPNAN